MLLDESNIQRLRGEGLTRKFLVRKLGRLLMAGLGGGNDIHLSSDEDSDEDSDGVPLRFRDQYGEVCQYARVCMYTCVCVLY